MMSNSDSSLGKPSRRMDFYFLFVLRRVVSKLESCIRLCIPKVNDVCSGFEIVEEFSDILLYMVTISLYHYMPI